jgi:hypothetical protein
VIVTEASGELAAAFAQEWLDVFLLYFGRVAACLFECLQSRSKLGPLAQELLRC